MAHVYTTTTIQHTLGDKKKKDMIYYDINIMYIKTLDTQAETLIRATTTIISIIITAEM